MKDTSHFITGCVTLAGTVMCSRMLRDCGGSDSKCAGNATAEHIVSVVTFATLTVGARVVMNHSNSLYPQTA
jgi:hypothetical protein